MKISDNDKERMRKIEEKDWQMDRVKSSGQRKIGKNRREEETKIRGRRETEREEKKVKTE